MFESLLKNDAPPRLSIVHVIYDDIRNPWCGGGGAYRIHEINKRLARDHEIVVLTGNYPGAKNEVVDQVPYIRVGIDSSYIVSRLSFTLLIPYFLRKFHGDIVANDCSFFAPCFADLYVKKPVINTIHHLMGRHAFNIYPLIGFFPFFSEKIFLRIAKNIITSAKQVREKILEHYPQKTIRDIPNAVSDDLFRLRGVENGFLLFLGRIDMYMKGLDLLVRAFSRIRDRSVTLKIAGGGKARDVKRLIELIRESGVITRIEYLGKVSEKEKLELFRTCLFLVMPSRFEGWGITAVEANAAGKPVVGTNIPALSEAVENGKTAVLVDPENDSALADAIDDLLQNPEKRHEMGRQGRLRARMFSWDSIAERQLQFYLDTIYST